MPSIVFNENEIETTGKGIVNKSGYVYVGRKHKGELVTWIKLKVIE